MLTIQMAKNQNTADKHDKQSQAEKNKTSKNGETLENFSLLKEVLRFNEATNEVQAADSDWLIIQGQMLRELFEGLRAYLGKGANIAIKAAGKTSGRRFFDSLIERDMQLEETPVVLNILFDQGGWGKAKIDIDLKAKTANMIINNCVLTRNTSSTKPSCHFLAGYFEGFCEKLFKTPTECVETKCKAKGDASCNFEVKAK